MTNTELRELDAWIAENVMGWKRANFLSSYGKGRFMVSRETGDIMAYDLKGEGFQPTTDPAAAMEVLKKCGKTKKNAIEIFCLRPDENRSGKESYWVNDPKTESETLELAIALFAKKLFTK
jgi:hypothetical protein